MVTASGTSRLGNAEQPCGPGFNALTETMRATLSAGGVVILGEIHDNPHHHALRATLLHALTIAPLRTARVFEHLRADQAAAISAVNRAVPPQPAAAVIAAIDWASGGWPDAKLFEPLFDPTFAPWPLVAGDPAKGVVRDVARGGIAAVPATLRERHALATPLPDTLQSALLDDLDAGHCGLVPRAHFTTMALAQRVRDAHLAEQTAQAAGEHGSAILFTGNGHVRSDRGVPLYLRPLLGRRPILTVALVETRPGLDPAAERVAAAVDVLIATPRVEREDPCIALRAQFTGKK
jgi:uncharacterized iron-regulated protein